MRRELLPYGIDVIVVRPGAVKTELLRKSIGPGVEGAYDRTDYAKALARFIGYAANGTKDGYSAEEFGGRVRGEEAENPLRHRPRQADRLDDPDPSARPRARPAARAERRSVGKVG